MVKHETKKSVFVDRQSERERKTLIYKELQTQHEFVAGKSAMSVKVEAIFPPVLSLSGSLFLLLLLFLRRNGFPNCVDNVLAIKSYILKPITFCTHTHAVFYGRNSEIGLGSLPYRTAFLFNGHLKHITSDSRRSNPSTYQPLHYYFFLSYF